MSMQVTRREKLWAPDHVTFDWLCDDDELRPIAFDSNFIRDENGAIELTLSNITGDSVAVAELQRMTRQLDAGGDTLVDVAQACADDRRAASREGWEYLAEALLDVARAQVKANYLDWTVETVCFQASVLA